MSSLVRLMSLLDILLEFLLDVRLEDLYIITLLENVTFLLCVPKINLKVKTCRLKFTGKSGLYTKICWFAFGVDKQNSIIYS